MPLSDHEQTVLNAMEVALRADSARPATNRRSRNWAIHQHLATSIGLLIAGTAVIAAGLALANTFGTGLGVLGFLLVVAAGWSATHLIAPLRRRLSTHISTQAIDPDQPPLP